MFTRNEIKAVYRQGEDAVCDLVESIYLEMAQKVSGVEERVKLLEVQKNKNSTNSSKPPSTDGYKKPTPNLRIKSGKKSGAQPGHQGKTLEMRVDCDKTENHSPPECTQCGHNLNEVNPIKTNEAQVDDLPPLKFVCHRSPQTS